MATLQAGYTLTGPAPATKTATITYTGLSCADPIQITGAQTYAIDLAMMPAAGLRVLRVEVDTTDAAGDTVSTPITLQYTANNVQHSLELSPGGHVGIASPAPTNGITALSIITTANAVVRVTAAG